MIMKSKGQLIFYAKVKEVYGGSNKFKPQNTLYTARQRVTELGFTLLAPYELARWED